MERLSEYLEDLARDLEAGGDLTVVVGWKDELLEVVVRNDLSIVVERHSALGAMPYSLARKPKRLRAAAISARRSGTIL